MTSRILILICDTLTARAEHLSTTASLNCTSPIVIAWAELLRRQYLKSRYCYLLLTIQFHNPSPTPCSSSAFLYASRVLYHLTWIRSRIPQQTAARTDPADLHTPRPLLYYHPRQLFPSVRFNSDAGAQQNDSVPGSLQCTNSEWPCSGYHCFSITSKNYFSNAVYLPSYYGLLFTIGTNSNFINFPKQVYFITSTKSSPYFPAALQTPLSSWR